MAHDDESPPADSARDAATSTDAGAGADAAPPDAPECRVLDAAALRALAHPLRYRLLEVLKEGGPATASDLGRRIGESSGSTSYHLRQLAAHGFIEEAPELGSARDRWWRATPGGWTLEGIEGFQDPSAQRAAAIVLDEFRRSRLESLERWHHDGPRWGPDWVAASIDMTSRLVLTRDEAARLRDELAAVVDRWRAQVGERATSPTRPAGSALVVVDVDVFPSGDPPGDATTTRAAQAGTSAPTRP